MLQFIFPEGSNGDVDAIRGFLFDEAAGLLNSIKSTAWYVQNRPAVAFGMIDRYAWGMRSVRNNGRIVMSCS